MSQLKSGGQFRQEFLERQDLDAVDSLAARAEEDDDPPGNLAGVFGESHEPRQIAGVDVSRGLDPDRPVCDARWTGPSMMNAGCSSSTIRPGSRFAWPRRSFRALDPQSRNRNRRACASMIACTPSNSAGMR